MRKPADRTIFEKVWTDKPEEHIFISNRHGIMAAADKYPKLPLQVVIAPRLGTPGHENHLASISLKEQLKIWTVAHSIGRKILQNCEPGIQRVMDHVEGFNVTDHPHVVLAAVRKGEAGVMYDPEAPVLGDEAVARTLEVIRFTPEESAVLELQLDEVERSRQL